MTDTRREKLADAMAAVEGGEASRMELLRRMQKMQLQRQLEATVGNRKSKQGSVNLPHISDPDAPAPIPTPLPYTEGSGKAAVPLPATSDEDEVARLMRKIRGPVKLQERMR